MINIIWGKGSARASGFVQGDVYGWGVWDYEWGSGGVFGKGKCEY